MQNVRTDAAIGEVVRALRADGVRSLVLKGPTLDEWYPHGPARVYRDGDIWVRASDLDPARATLAGLGFRPALEDRDLPSWWDQHAISWVRAADQATIDLHRTIDGIGVAPEAAWDVMWADSVPFTIAHESARRLSEPGRVLNVVLHSAQHGLADPKATAHVEAATAVVHHDVWVAAAQLARRLLAFDAFVAGMRALPAGAILADELGLTGDGSIRVSLIASGAPPVSLGFMQLYEARGWPARVRLLASKIAPPPALVRAWWPAARRNHPMLAVAYLYRPIWLVLRAPAGLRAWRAAKRDAGGRKST
jgi:hypothetical protein